MKDCIPFSLNRDKHPKLATMLFVAHAGAVAANAGKVAFTQNPVAINYPEWLAFAKYSYIQLKWILIEKPANVMLMYVERLTMNSMLLESEKAFTEFSSDCIVVFR